MNTSLPDSLGDDPETFFTGGQNPKLAVHAFAQTIEDHQQTFTQLAQEVGEAGFACLQDICALIAEGLAFLSDNNATPDLFAELANLPESIGEYALGMETAIPNIIQILRHPSLQIPLNEGKLAMLAEQLSSELAAQNVPMPSVADDFFADLDMSASTPEPSKNTSKSQDYPITDDFFGDLDLGLDTETATPEFSQETSDLAALNLADENYPIADDFFGDVELGFDAETTDPGPSKETLELVELLEMEAALMTRLLSAIDLDDLDTLSQQLQGISKNLERYENAANMAEFRGLAMICGHVNTNVRAFYAAPDQFAEKQFNVLSTWISNVSHYLSRFNDLSAKLQILQQLGDKAWALPVEMEAAAGILAELQITDTETSDEENAANKLTATPDDVSLATPDDVNHELLTILLRELPVQTQVFSAAVQALQSGGSLADLETAQRTAHNVKGAANTVGIRGIAQLTHSLEDILVACAQHQKLPSAALLNTLTDAADCLEAMSESLNGLGPEPDEALTVLQNVMDWANLIETGGIDAIDTVIGQEPSITEEPQDTGQVTSEPPAEKPQAAMVRIEAQQLEDFFRQASENIVLNSLANERLRIIKNQLQAMEAQFELLRQLGDELDQLIDLKDLSGRTSGNPASHFDALEMDQYNELHTAGRRMVEAAFDARELKLDASKELEAMGKLLEEHYRIATENQESIIKTCLMPVSLLTPRLERSLRQTCRLTGKACDLELTGEELTVDSIIDPLLHILRNSVDHGIEAAETRRTLGKPERGIIRMEFSREGNHAVVHVRDDGRGLDYEAIRQAAVQRGVLTADQTVTEEELKRLILRPNFSTRTEITQTSGRGVGMDVVNFQVQELGGSLALHSVTGEGLTVEIKIPLPLSRSRALLTQIGNYKMALSNKGIMKILFVGAHALSDDGQSLTVDGIVYPAVFLNKLLDIYSPKKSGQPSQTALIVQNSAQLHAVILDTISDSQDIVIKKMGQHVQKMAGFMGAAIMGDGSVAPVLDLPELLKIAGNASHHEDIEYPEPPEPIGLTKALVVDDSLSQRRALEQLLQDAGFQVTTARDGVEAADLLSKELPDIVLTDLEMPRMNGIELAAHMRTRDNLKRLPIIMVTSRTTEAHRKIAEDVGINRYLVKPVREDDLLMMIQTLISGTEEAG